MKKSTRALFFKLVLVTVGLASSLAFSEAALHILRPRYGAAAAGGGQEENRWRLFANPRNAVRQIRHPDLGVTHTVYYNSLGLKQCREFASAKKDPSVIRIGFFGDSFSENAFMPCQYSYSEPLEYLLNRTGKKFEVLNFGTSGYGTDQCYLQYADEGTKLDLDAVVYMAYENDFYENLSHRLIDLDEQGNIHIAGKVEPSLAKRLLRHFYLTYFSMDVYNRIKARLGSGPADANEKERTERADRMAQNALTGRGIAQNDVLAPKCLRLYYGILKLFAAEALKNGQQFYTVFVPNDFNTIKAMKAITAQEGVDGFDLLPDFLRESPRPGALFFQNDRHWNEEGNKIAAVYLFKFLAGRLKIPYGGDDFIKKGLYEYYSSVADGKPRLSSAWMEPSPVPASLRSQIRAHFLALETDARAKGFARDTTGVLPGYAANMEAGLSLMENGRAAEAVRFFSRAAEQKPGSALAHGCLGTALARSGERESARMELTRAIELDPKLSDARAELEKLR